MACVTSSDSQALDIALRDQDVATSGDDKDVVTSGDDRALDPVPMTGTTYGGTEAYRPMTEPVSPSPTALLGDGAQLATPTCARTMTMKEYQLRNYWRRWPESSTTIVTAFCDRVTARGPGLDGRTFLSRHSVTVASFCMLHL